MQGHLQRQSSVKRFDTAFAIKKFNFCGELFKLSLKWECGISKKQFLREIVPLVVPLMPFG